MRTYDYKQETYEPWKQTVGFMTWLNTKGSQGWLATYIKEFRDGSYEVTFVRERA